MILVTGATGHIGNVLIRELLARGEHVRALLHPGEDCLPLEGLDIECVVGNLLDLASLVRAMRGACTVFHLAGIISIQSGHDARVRQVNLQGTRHVLEAARQTGVRRLVYTSSIHALQRVPEGILVDESLPFDPHNPVGEYDRSKAEATLEVLDATRSGLDAVIVCPTGVIGPYDFRGSEMGSLIRDWMRPGLHILLDGHYDFVDVRDVAHGLILAAENGRSGEAYILSGERISLVQIHNLVQQSGGARSARVQVPVWLARCAAALSPLFARLARTRPLVTRYSLETVLGNSLISGAKAARELGFLPRPLSESIADSVHWWKARQQRSIGWGRKV